MAKAKSGANAMGIDLPRILPRRAVTVVRRRRFGMLFTEPAFLFLFLPATLLVYGLTPTRWRNVVLGIASLAFYALGEIRFVGWLMLSIAVNYVLAIWIEQTRGGRWARAVLALGIASDLVLLLVFKYAGWLGANLDSVLALLHAAPIRVPALVLPLGISFFTFHKISYKVDVYRGESNAQRNPITLALYILFFPQLIAGPIVRYHEIAAQLDFRTAPAKDRLEGARRCVVGLAKKIIVANSVAVLADRIFDVPMDRLSCSAAWLGIFAYTLQIYFDFSGYSDMAIGLALLFGFRFPENFDYPYSSASLTEFWRRWHMSLSRWFRDYVYVPLGGNRLGPGRTYANLVAVFFLCGLWHGASWEFVVWGLYHGAFLVLERVGFGRVVARWPRILRHAYAIMVVMVGWVFFRAGALGKGCAYVARMFGVGVVLPYADPATSHLDRWVVFVLAIGATLSFPISKAIGARVEDAARGGEDAARRLLLVQSVAVGALFIVSVAFVAAATYNPFLYFRF
jgi:alginate O-acetyltransferase complex protein AlgI